MVKTLLASALTLAFVAAPAAAQTHGTTSLPATDIFVRWKPGTESARAERYRAAGAQVLWRSTLVPGLERVSVPRGRTLDVAVNRFANDPNVLYAEPNYRVRRVLAPMPAGVRIQPMDSPSAPPNDPMYSQQWALRAATGVDAPGAWAVTTGSSDIKVAVIDTGIEASHPELSDRIAPGHDFIDRDENPRDTHGHGTHVSGIIGARTNNGAGIAGINHQVTIVPIRTVPDNGDETDANVIESFEFAVASGARVANCSFGKDQSGRAVGDAIAAAGEHGLLTVVAAGNDSADNNVDPSYPANFRTPNMIVVAASTSSGDMAYFSNYGLGMVDIAAPGASVLAPVLGGRYASWSGTSMASPQVAGVAALALAANPSLGVAELKDILLRTATAVPAFAGRVDTGGRVNAAAAVAEAAARAGNPR